MISDIKNESPGKFLVDTENLEPGEQIKESYLKRQDVK